MTTTFPAKFLFYKDSMFLPLTRLAAVTVTQTDGGIYELSTAPPTDEYQMPASFEGSAIFVMTAKLKLKAGGVASRRIYAHPSPARNLTTGEDIPVITFANPSSIFGPHVLKLNITLHPIPSSTPALSVTAPAIPPNLPSPVPATPKPSRQKAKAAGDLSLFVAKQLLELAQSKHEMCPIVAEEFAAGHTAVMPCGHLFAAFAIEETFKKEPNKCPTCRLHGYPTFV